MQNTLDRTLVRLDPGKFKDPLITAKGERRASVTLKALDTLWLNTGTLCNLTCEHCYIESSPTNDRLTYLSAAEVRTYLDEIESQQLGTTLIGFTGGEPFMNPELPRMLEEVLSRDLSAIVLTNAMRPMIKVADALLALRARYGKRLVLRVSVDHYARDWHERERGPRTWQPTIDGLRWLVDHGFSIDVAGRMLSGEPEAALREGYARLFARERIPVDAADPIALMLFPEMDEQADVPEITDACWGILKKSPDAMMCSHSRMIVKRKGDALPTVVACTLLPYDPQFSLGHTLTESRREVSLNHPHCAKFCVLGGAACSRT